MLSSQIRYWGVERTRDELKLYMRQLLPKTSKGHGLVGWWTMEEGVGSFIEDVTESRYRIKMGTVGVGWTNQNKTGLEPPTPSHRETLVCPIELKRARLAKKARLHFQLVRADITRQKDCSKQPQPIAMDLLLLCRLRALKNVGKKS